MSELVILALSLLSIAFFAGIEIAFVSANRLRIELLKDKSTSARIVAYFNANPSKFISTMLIGLNIALVVFGSTMSSLLEKESHQYSFIPNDQLSLMLMETFISTFIILFLGELIPKLLFRINADQMLLNFAYITKYLFYIPLLPISFVFHAVSNWVMRLVMGSDFIEKNQDFTKEDLEYLIKESAIEEEEEADNLNSDIFENALYLKDEKVKNCMVPRPEIEAIAIDESIEELKKEFISSKHSRIIVFEDNIDNIKGYVHHFDLLSQPKSIKEVLRPIDTVPASMNAQDLLRHFTKENKNIAWVVDEYGGTAGLITLEDLLEEIFGEIEDEHDTDDQVEKQLSDNEFIFSGRLEVDYLNEEYNLGIPLGEYETLAGYIVMTHEEIPKQGEILQLNHFEIKILKARNNRIETVRLKVLPKED